MKDEKILGKKLLLVDGHGLAFRGFYALPEMNAPDGTPTNAVLGFMNMLFKALDEWKPDGIGLFFDPKGPTKRSEVYEAYKDGRRPTPDAFKQQMPLILELSEALGFPVFVRDRVEADDLIAATAVAAAEEGWDTVILSADKDLLQLLRNGLTMARPTKGISEFKLYDEAFFTAEYGFPPCAMADYLALVGDSVDNIPGVAGIGDKTAKQLLVEYGSLDGIYRSLDALPKGRRASLENGKESAYQSYMLVLPQDEEAIDRNLLQRGEGDMQAAMALCERLGLKRLVARVGLDKMGLNTGKVSSPAGEEEKRALENVPVGELFSENLLALADHPYVLMAPNGKWAKLAENDLDDFRKWLNGNRLILADYRHWCRHFEFLRDCPDCVWDVELAHYFLHPDAKSHSIATILGRYPGMGEELASEILSLWESFRESEFVDELDRVMAEIDVPLTPVLLGLQERGLSADIPELRELDADLHGHLSGIEGKIFKAAGGAINLNSPKQVGELLFEKLRLPVIKKTKTGYSTDVSVLEELARLPELFGEIPSGMLEYRECSKMSSGFVQPFIKHAEDSADHKIHSTFLHAVTGTARLASRDPNVQNLPVFGEWAARFRRAITPSAPDRIFVAADYSQIELRVLAHLSGEERLLDAFRNNRDIHLETASWVFGLEPDQITPEQRRFAKTVNFGLIYGMGAHGLAQRMGIQRHQAAELVNRYFSVLPRVKRYLEDSAKDAKARGYTRSVLGRIRPLSEVTTVEGRGGGSIDRVAVNTPIQSTAADIAKIALMRFHHILKEEHPDSFLVLQVHDSLICEAPSSKSDEVEALLVRTMEDVRYIDVPLKADPKRGHSLAEV